MACSNLFILGLILFAAYVSTSDLMLRVTGRPLVAAKAIIVLGPPGHYKTSMANLLVNGGGTSESDITKPFTTCVGDENCTHGVFVAYSRELGLYIIDTPGLSKMFTARLLFQQVRQFLEEFPLQIVRVLVALEHDRGRSQLDSQAQELLRLLSSWLANQEDRPYSALRVCPPGDEQPPLTPIQSNVGYIELKIPTLLYYNTRNSTISATTLASISVISTAQFRNAEFLSLPFGFGQDPNSQDNRRTFFAKIGNALKFNSEAQHQPMTIARCVHLVNELGQYFETAPSHRPKSEVAIVSQSPNLHPCNVETFVIQMKAKAAVPLFDVNRPLFEELVLSFFRELNLCEVSHELHQYYFSSFWSQFFGDSATASLTLEIGSRISSIFVHPVLIIFPAAVSLLGSLGLDISGANTIVYLLALAGLYTFVQYLRARFFPASIPAPVVAFPTVPNTPVAEQPVLQQPSLARLPRAQQHQQQLQLQQEPSAQCEPEPAVIAGLTAGQFEES